MRYFLAITLFLLIPWLASGQFSPFDNFIKSYASENDFNGTILVGKNNKTIYYSSFGLANRPFKVPVNKETKFKIASVTKAFTSVLILQLYEQGKIDLKKTINNYLPCYKGEAGDKVTIHQLLNHTSGMAGFDTLTSQASAIKYGIEKYQRPFTTDEYVSKYCSDRLVNEPGKVFSYNNGEYIILGKIIETIYGKAFGEVLKQQILEPLGMLNTGMLFQQNIIDNLADTYFMREDLKQWVNDLPVYIENWYASGAMYSTAPDLMKFSDALFGNKLLTTETVNKMLEPGLDSYGYGLWVSNFDINNKIFKVVKRPGSIMGAQAMLFHIPDENLTIIILSNSTSDLDTFALEIAKHLIE